MGATRKLAQVLASANFQERSEKFDHDFLQRATFLWVLALSFPRKERVK